MTDDEIQRIRSNLYEVDRFLGPYPYEIWDKWKLLSDRITGTFDPKIYLKCANFKRLTKMPSLSEPLARKLMPESGIIRSALELVSSSEPITETGDIKKQDVESPSLTEETPSSSTKHQCPTSGKITPLLSLKGDLLLDFAYYVSFETLMNLIKILFQWMLAHLKDVDMDVH